MLNLNNKVIANAIGAAYCGSNLVCSDSLFNRLNTFLDDTTFVSMLSTLTSRRFAVAEFSLPMSFDRIRNKYYSQFSVMDLINGTSSVYPVQIDAAFYNPETTDWKKTLESINRPWLKFEKIVGTKILFSSNQHGGYEIAYVTNPTGGGGTGGSGGTGGTGGGTPGGGEVGGGAIIVPDELAPSGTQIINTPAATSFNVNDLLIPGAILAGLYLLMKK